MIDLETLKSRFIGAVWEADISDMPRWRAPATAVLRIGFVVVRDLADGQLNLRAMSLVYTTLLSMVPVLAIGFSVLKGFGVHNQIEPALLNFLAPMGDKGVEITARIIEFVENVKAGVLGSLGLALLFYTVVSLMQKIERAFNYAWHVTRPRPLAQRFSEYLAVVLVGPVLVFTAIGITASLRSSSVVEMMAAIEPFGALIRQVTRLLPYLLVIAAFAFVYVFVPNTKVRLRSALVGALVAGVLWETVGWAFASFIVGSAKYTAIYSAFATLVLFMVWLYLSWLILLIGASIAFYHQHPQYRAAGHADLRFSNRLKERLALMIAALVGRAYYSGEPPWTVDRMARRLGMPPEAAEWVLEALGRRGLLTPTADEPPAYLPARPLEATPLGEVLEAVRAADERADLDPARLPADPPTEALAREIEAAAAAAVADRTLKDLALLEDRSATPIAGQRRQA